MRESGERFRDKFRTGAPATIADVKKAFCESLGEERVSVEAEMLRLRFRFNDTKEFTQFNDIPTLLNERQIKFLTNVEGEDAIVTIPLKEPGLQENLNILEKVAKRLVVKVVGVDGHLITPLGKDHPIVEATGVPWDLVHKSPYGTVTLEPAREAPIAEDRRTSEEFAVGYTLFEDATRDSRGDVRGWLAHQRDVEAKGGVQVHTAIPDDWVSTGHVERLTTDRAGLQKVFSRGGSSKK